MIDLSEKKTHPRQIQDSILLFLKAFFCIEIR